MHYKQLELHVIMAQAWTPGLFAAHKILKNNNFVKEPAALL